MQSPLVELKYEQLFFLSFNFWYLNSLHFFLYSQSYNTNRYSKNFILLVNQKHKHTKKLNNPEKKRGKFQRALPYIRDTTDRISCLLKKKAICSPFSFPQPKYSKSSNLLRLPATHFATLEYTRFLGKLVFS